MQATEVSRSHEPKAWWEAILLFPYLSLRGHTVALYGRGNNLSLFVIAFIKSLRGRVFSFHGRGNLLSLFCHYETVPFMFKAISIFRRDELTSFNTFHQNLKEKNLKAIASSAEIHCLLAMTVSGRHCEAVHFLFTAVAIAFTILSVKQQYPLFGHYLANHINTTAK